jgi:integrase/recombinase XerC
LPRLIGDRRAGPIFLAERRPAPARTPAAVDLCPVTGRGRLSYERAEYLFKQSSLKVARKGWTLHQLRHSALTHLAEAGVNLPLLMAKSGHQNLRSLQRYARPGTEAVAAMTAAHDPARRRR